MSGSWALRAYPRERRAEIADTLAEMGIRPPAWNLLRHGLRARLGRPASRRVVRWAVLAATVVGLFTAAASVRLASTQVRPQLTPAEVAAVLPGYVAGSVLYHPLAGHQSTAVAIGLHGGPAVDAATAVSRVRNQLADSGWRLSEPVADAPHTCTTGACDPALGPDSTMFVARRGDAVLVLAFRGTDVEATSWRVMPTAVYPAGIAGGLAGFVAAWFLFGWISRRTGSSRPVAVLFVTAMVSWWLPVLAFTSYYLVAAWRDPTFGWRCPPLWEWLGQPEYSLLFFIGCVSIGGALLPARHRLPSSLLTDIC